MYENIISRGDDGLGYVIDYFSRDDLDSVEIVLKAFPEEDILKKMARYAGSTDDIKMAKYVVSKDKDMLDQILLGSISSRNIQIIEKYCRDASNEMIAAILLCEEDWAFKEILKKCFMKTHPLVFVKWRMLRQ